MKRQEFHYASILPVDGKAVSRVPFDRGAVRLRWWGRKIPGPGL